MNLSDLFKDTIQTLWAHKLRTFLTMFGITWGIISITLMVAATEGLRVGLKHNAETFGKDVMIFFAGRTSMQAGGMRAGREIHWNEDDYVDGFGASRLLAGTCCRRSATRFRCAAVTTAGIC